MFHCSSLKRIGSAGGTDFPRIPRFHASHQVAAGRRRGHPETEHLGVSLKNLGQECGTPAVFPHADSTRAGLTLVGAPATQTHSRSRDVGLEFGGNLDFDLHGVVTTKASVAYRFRRGHRR